MRLADFIGNRELVGILSRGRFPQAAVFGGQEGVGKRTLALLLAALANCKDPTETDLCGRCPSCLQAAAGSHPDIQLYSPTGNNVQIDSMRRLSREAQFRPFSGKERYFIVDQAEKLTEEAANSLLKTLEEPPSTSRIILVTAFPARLLPTVRSRCQHFMLKSLSAEEIQDYLEGNREFDNCRLRARFAGGSLGTALTLDLEDRLRDGDHMMELLAEFLKKGSTFASIFLHFESGALRTRLKKRDQTLGLLEVLATLCYDLYYLVVETPDRVVYVDRLEDLANLAQGLEFNQLTGLLRQIEYSRRDVQRYVNPQMCFETLWLAARGQFRT